MNSALRLFLAAIFAFSAAARAEDDVPPLTKPTKIISQPDFMQPLGAEWSIGKGKWEPANGVLAVTEIPEEKHVPVLHLKTGPVSVVFDCEFRYNGAKIFYVGFDSASKHCGRVVVMPKKVMLCEDSTEVKGKTPSDKLAEMAVDLKPEEWQKLHVEYAGERLAIRLNGQKLGAEHPYLGTPKARWWMAAGSGAEVRNVRVSEGEPIPLEGR